MSTRNTSQASYISAAMTKALDKYPSTPIQNSNSFKQKRSNQEAPLLIKEAVGMGERKRG